MKLKSDNKNFNRHTRKGLKGIADSIAEVGVIEAVTTAADGTILSGNARNEKMQEAGITKQIIVETDGTEQVVIVRKDIKPYTEKFHRAAYLANKTAVDDINIDIAAVERCFAELGVSFGGVDGDIKSLAIKELYDSILERYIYQPCEPKKALAECADMTEYDKRMQIIESSNADESVKEAARLWATRFIKFDYTEIANNYSVQDFDGENAKLFRDLAVVVVGKSDALKQGLLKMLSFDDDENE